MKAGTSCASSRGERSTKTTPSGYCSWTISVTRSARLVLPTPPGPVSVTNRMRLLWRSFTTSASACSRPTSGRRGGNRLAKGFLGTVWTTLPSPGLPSPGLPSPGRPSLGDGARRSHAAKTASHSPGSSSSALTSWSRLWRRGHVRPRSMFLTVSTVSPDGAMAAKASWLSPRRSR